MVYGVIWLWKVVWIAGWTPEKFSLAYFEIVVRDRGTDLDARFDLSADFPFVL